MDVVDPRGTGAKIPQSRLPDLVADPSTPAASQSICPSLEARQITRFEGFTSPDVEEYGTNKFLPRSLSQSFPSHKIKSGLLSRLEVLGPPKTTYFGETTYFGAPVFCRRTIHWYSEEQTSLCFDVDKECLNPIPMPPYLTSDTIQYFGESRGHLQLIMHTTSDVEFNVLELKEDYSGWWLRHHVNFGTFKFEFCDMYGIGSEWFRAFVLRMVEAERKEESELVMFVCGRLVSYKLKDRSLKQLMYLVPYKEAECVWKNAFPFIEILCPV